jgi:hypothetical protein
MFCFRRGHKYCFMCFKLALVENFLEKFKHTFRRSRWIETEVAALCPLDTAILIVQLVGKHRQTQHLFNKIIFFNKEFALTVLTNKFFTLTL